MRVAALTNKTKRERQCVLTRFHFRGPAQGPDLVDRVVVPFCGISATAERRPPTFKCRYLVKWFDQLNELVCSEFLILEIFYETFDQEPSLQRGRVVR